MSIDWILLTPAAAPAAGALLVLLLDLLGQRRVSRWAAPAIGVAANLVGLAAILLVAGRRTTSSQLGGHPDRLTLCTPGPGGACFVDVSGPAVGLAASVLLSGAVVVVLMWPNRQDPPPVRGTVPVALVLTAVCGGVVVATGRDVATWLIGLELATLPLVALVALAGTSRAAHGSLSFVLVSVLSFGLLAVAVALWVVATGSAGLTGAAVEAAWRDTSHRPALTLAVMFALAGLGFKVAAVPFHTWVPPTYTASPLAVTTALASVSKVAAVAGLVALVRPLVEAKTAGVDLHAAAFGLGLLACLTMTVGGLIALRQDDVVRLIAWSAIAQGGWLLFGLAALSEAGLRATSAYAAAYALASIVVLTVVAVVSGAGVEAIERRQLSAYAGLFRRHPGLAFALTLGLLSLAGLPPGVLGLVAKVVVIAPVVAANLWWLAVIAAANVVLGVAVYVRWIRVLLAPPDPGADAPDAAASSGIALGVATTILAGLSIAPHFLLALVR
ncbi:MAG: NADH-quinone oxidoreductase subunit N [Nostocoides sp.]